LKKNVLAYYNDGVVVVNLKSWDRILLCNMVYEATASLFFLIFGQNPNAILLGILCVHKVPIFITEVNKIAIICDDSIDVRCSTI
jgi:lipopolysaccharide biosynthesis glycosyltransferase